MSSGDGRDDKRDVLPPVRRRQGLGSLAALEDHTVSAICAMWATHCLNID